MRLYCQKAERESQRPIFFFRLNHEKTFVIYPTLQGMIVLALAVMFAGNKHPSMFLSLFNGIAWKEMLIWILMIWKNIYFYYFYFIYLHDFDFCTVWPEINECRILDQAVKDGWRYEDGGKDEDAKNYPHYAPFDLFPWSFPDGFVEFCFYPLAFWSDPSEQDFGFADVVEGWRVVDHPVDVVPLLA